MSEIRIIILFAVFCVSVLFLVANVSASFSVTSHYFDKRPLELYPGESGEGVFVLKNPKISDRELIRVEADFDEDGGGIATYSGVTEFDIRQGDEETLKINVKMPKDAEVGRTYIVGMLFKEIPDEESGENVQFSVGIRDSFPVIVREKTVEEISLEKGQIGFWILGGFLALAILIVLVGIVRVVIKRRAINKEF